MGDSNRSPMRRHGAPALIQEGYQPSHLPRSLRLAGSKAFFAQSTFDGYGTGDPSNSFDEPTELVDEWLDQAVDHHGKSPVFA